jgi:large subunit ribosomal protein L10e
MTERPGRIYSDVKSQSYTRKEYMSGVPGTRIVQFDLGDKEREFPVVGSLIPEERCQILHGALESSRVACNRVLMKNIGALNYHLKVNVYPHEVVRENKQAVGAGADRVSDGMRNAFGKAIGTAARVDADQPIMTVRVEEDDYEHMQEAFRKANMKLPCPSRMKLRKGEPLVR